MPKRLTTKQIAQRAITEKQWQQTVVDLFHMNGYHLIFHDQDSRMNNPGFPDWVALRVNPPDLIFAELKKETGRLSSAQEEWLNALRKAGQDAFVWRPSDYDDVVKRLARRS